MSDPAQNTHNLQELTQDPTQQNQEQFESTFAPAQTNSTHLPGASVDTSIQNGPQNPLEHPVET
jgi:hypothetical protein